MTNRILKRKLKTIVTHMLILISMLFATSSYALNFGGERYRGWLWFEEKPQTVKPNNAKQPADLPLTAIEAKAEIEQFAKELEELKFMMLARPTVENVKAYRDKEKTMWTQALKLHDSWDMANLLYPEQRDLINNPSNVHAVKLKRSLELTERELQIKGLAKQFDLVLLFSSSCKYCEMLSPVLKEFGLQYGFNVEAINANLNNVVHEYFKTAHAPELIQKLNITAFPTVIAVSHDSKMAFELIRGYVTMSELEEYSLLAVKHLATLSSKEVSKVR